MLGRLNGLKVDECMVDVTAGETRSKEFAKINPLKQIPCLKVPKLYSSDESSTNFAPTWTFAHRTAILYSAKVQPSCAI